MKYFDKTPRRVSHTIDRSGSIKNIPHTQARKPKVNTPLPLASGKRSRCASCGGHRF